MPRRLPQMQRWTPARIGAWTVAVLLTCGVGYVVTVVAWTGWCSMVGIAVIDDRVAELDRGAVVRSMLLEHAGLALWALPWLALAVLRRHRRLEAAAYVVIAALLLVWSAQGLPAELSDPIRAEQFTCWHF